MPTSHLLACGQWQVFVTIEASLKVKYETLVMVRNDHHNNSRNFLCLVYQWIQLTHAGEKPRVWIWPPYNGSFAQREIVVHSWTFTTETQKVFHGSDAESQ